MEYDGKKLTNSIEMQLKRAKIIIFKKLQENQGVH